MVFSGLGRISHAKPGFFSGVKDGDLNFFSETKQGLNKKNVRELWELLKVAGVFFFLMERKHYLLHM